MGGEEKEINNLITIRMGATYLYSSLFFLRILMEMLQVKIHISHLKREKDANQYKAKDSLTSLVSFWGEVVPRSVSLVSEPANARLAPRLGKGIDGEEALGGRQGSAGRPARKRWGAHYRNSWKKTRRTEKKMVRWIRLNCPVSHP